MTSNAPLVFMFLIVIVESCLVNKPVCVWKCKPKHSTSSYSSSSDDTPADPSDNLLPSDQPGSIYQSGSISQSGLGRSLAGAPGEMPTERPDDIRKEYPTALSPYYKKCVCGQETSEKGKPWSVMIHFNSLGLLVARPCLGTVIAHNLVITSHRCLVKSGRHLSPFDVWQPPPKHRESEAAHPENITVVTLQSEVFEVENIVFNSNYSPYVGTELPSGDDIALIVVDGDMFMNKEITSESGKTLYQHLQLPVCIPRKSHNMEHMIKNIIKRYGYYYGAGGEFLDDPKPRRRDVNELIILEGEFCDKEAKFGDFSDAEALCIRTATALPTTEGGPLLSTNVSGYLLKAPKNNTGFELALPPQTSFLLGVCSATVNKANGKHISYAYFGNVLQNIDFIERTANEYASLWCATPEFPDTKKARPIDLRLEEWPWENEEIKPRDESLSCSCGLKYDDEAIAVRISGGEDAVPHEFGWMVKFVFSWRPNDEELDDGAALCGASVINDRIVLTSAHCVVEDEDSENHNEVFFELIKSHKLYVGSHKFANDTDARVLKVKDIIVHPGYIPNKKIGCVSYDLALVILDEPLVFATGYTKASMNPRDIRPICLPKGNEKIELKTGTELTALGWGLVNPYDDEPGFPKVLQKIQVPILDRRACSDQYLEPIPETIICVGNFTSGLSLGDSGGPTAYRKHSGKYFQVGVDSYVRDIDMDDEDQEEDKWLGFIVDLQQFIPFIEYYSNAVKARWCKK